MVPGLAAAPPGAGLGEPLFPLAAPCRPALPGTSSRCREPPRGGRQLSFSWPLKITCARCQDVPWDVLSGVCPAQTQTRSPPQAHQQQGQFLNFGGIAQCWFAVPDALAVSANEKCSQENGSKEVEFQNDCMNQSCKCFPVAETRSMRRRETVKQQLKAATLFQYLLQLVPCFSWYTQQYFFLPRLLMHCWRLLLHLFLM